MVCGSVSHTSDRWNARQSNMTSVSSAVTMTAFEPVIVACNAYKRKQVSASSCVDCSSATSTYSSSVILEQVSSQVTYNALSCSIILSLYHCIVHSPTKNFIRPVVLKELHRNFLHCCMLCPPIPGICTERLCLHIGLFFQNF